MMLVLGSGFGLYGHAAALAGLGHEVGVPLRYRPFVRARPELASLEGRFSWLDDERKAMAEARLVCFARRPDDNARLVFECVQSGKGGSLVIEKPIAALPQLALQLESTLAAADRSWAVPYLFLHCDWFHALGDAVARGRDAEIHWTHRSAAASGNWKRNESEGGGALAFYFVHCLAVIEALCPGATIECTRTRRPDGTESVVATADAGSSRLSIVFDMQGDPRFTIVAGETTVYSDTGPFGAAPAAGREDPRVPVLQRFYRALGTAESFTNASRFSRAVTRHWDDVNNTLVHASAPSSAPTRH